MEAASTKISSFKNREIITKALVSSSALHGVLNLAFILPRKAGSNPSWLSGTRDLAAVIIPAFAVERNAKTAAIAKPILP